ncbi:CYTH domain-containing protein [Microbacterium sp.]|uniref:CYTH domain-containing protein n=1 Tax=Microbacterium sp. TaxID=51671 RepID=UPI003A8697AB
MSSVVPGPEYSFEVEQKYDVDADTAVPDWAALAGVASVDAPDRRALDARYFDTADGALARSGTALRRRTGGPDAGWHVKRSAVGGKHETRWPLGEGAHDEATPPPPVLDAVAELASPPFVVRARIRTDRTATVLRDGSGHVLAEFVDDRVTATDVARSVTTEWREWEFELGAAAPAEAAGKAALFAAADRLVTAAGGRVAPADSKLRRALGG